MIPFASQRGGGQDLATHLQNSHDNEIMEVVEIRGAIAADLHGAFKEWEVQAETLTRCRKYLYSLSINPDPQQGEMTREQYFDYIARVEGSLGLSGQPRAIVFHTKHGREHCHAVWSRIDPDHEKAVHIAFDREKLMRVTREFARDHFFELPDGYETSRKAGQDTLYERVLKNETGLSKADHTLQVTEAWRHSDNAPAFVQALADRGYILATGNRPYVLVDFYGGIHAVSKLIDDKAVKTKDIRAFLEKEFPPESLPSIEEAKTLAKMHRAFLERAVSAEATQHRLDVLRHDQQLRRLALEQEMSILFAQQQLDRESLRAAQRDARQLLRQDYLARVRTTRDTRSKLWPRGLAAFLGKVTGITAVRRAVHRYQDRKALASHQEDRARLAAKHAREKAMLELRQKMQRAEIERKKGKIEQVERRELNSLKRDDLRDRRVKKRGIEESMPALSTGPRSERSGDRSGENHNPGEHGADSDLTATHNRAARDPDSEKQREKDPGLDQDQDPLGRDRD